jgi:hypothetical protein
MRLVPTALAAAAGLLLSATSASAQLHITPAFGAFIPASDVEGLRSGAEERRLARESTLGLGLNVELGWLRGSIAYASGATLNERGVQNREDIGDGSVLAAAADLVLRPLPRLIAQPYILAGAGLKRQDYSYDDDGLSNLLPRDRSDVAVHVGVGADLMLGSFGLMAEITDYITRHEGGGFGQHDAFAFVGLKFRIGGR